jgi:hypothetical protein
MTDSTAAAALSGDNGSANPGAAETPSSAPSWMEGFDEDTRAYVGNKAWQSPNDMLASYRALERYAGGSKAIVEMPGEDADETKVNEFYNKLGRPESPDKYGLKAPEGADPKVTELYSKIAHKHGLTAKQAQGVFGEWNQEIIQMGAQSEAEMTAAAEREVADIRKEWGQAFQQNLDAGRRAAASLGYDQAKLNALEEKLGPAETLRLFATLGSKMGEDSFVGGEREGSSGFGLTPAAARQQIADLKLNNDFMGKYLSGDKDALSKMQRLMEAAHAGS